MNKNIDREKAKQEIEKINKKISIYVTSMVFMLLVSLSLGVTYAVYQLDAEQEESNQVSVGCFDIEFEDSGTSNTYTNLSLTNSYPISTQTALTKTPYTFKITNTCDYIARTNIAINVLKTSSVSALATQQGKEIGDMLVASIKEGNNTASEPRQLSSLDEGTIALSDTETDVSYILKTDYLEENESKTYSIWMWVPEEIDGVEVGNESQGLTLYSKIDIYSQAISGSETVSDVNVAYIRNGQQSQLKNLSIKGGTDNSTNVGQDGTIDIVVSGKNLFNGQRVADYCLNNNGCNYEYNSSTGVLKVKQNDTRSWNTKDLKTVPSMLSNKNYTISGTNYGPKKVGLSYSIRAYDTFENGVYGGNGLINDVMIESNSNGSRTFTPQLGCLYIVKLYHGQITSSDLPYDVKVQIEYGSQVTTFEPYKERRYTIQLKDTSNNTINGLSSSDTLKKVNDKWVIDNGTTQTELASATQNALNSITIYDGISNIWVDDDIQITNISATYLS